MNLSGFLKKWQEMVSGANRLGIPVPVVRDPQTGKGSITAALVVFSAGLFGVCILFMLAMAIGKWAGFFAITDLSITQVKTAADYSFQFLLAALGGYLGRHLQKGETTEKPVSEPPKPSSPASQDHSD